MTNVTVHGVELDAPTDALLGDAWIGGAERDRIEVVNPATEEPIAHVTAATPADGQAAVDAAYDAGRAWAARPPRERSEVLRRAYELMVAEADRFARLIVSENGKALPDARGEVSYAAEFFRWYAEESVRAQGMVTTAPSGGNRIMVLEQPIGVSLLITPWNFPAAMATRKIGPALAAGCSVVLKPASETPLTALAIGELLLRAGVPSGVVNVLPTTDPGAFSNAVLGDPRVRKLSFTGSTEVGRLLLRAAADSVVDSSMELGGNAPFIVFGDADIDQAIEGAMLAKMRNGGQACTAANRFYVERSIADEFTNRLAAAMGDLTVGDGAAPGVDVGALINADAAGSMARTVDVAEKAGATRVTGGAWDGPGYFYRPTVLADVPADCEILGEEIFGPVAPITVFDPVDDVIAMANATDHGLVAYVYTTALDRALRVSEALEYGMVGVNRGLVSDPAAPFGGVKESGIGREGGHEGMLEFMESKYLSLSWDG